MLLFCRSALAVFWRLLLALPAKVCQVISIGTGVVALGSAIYTVVSKIFG